MTSVRRSRSSLATFTSHCAQFIPGIMVSNNDSVFRNCSASEAVMLASLGVEGSSSGSSSKFLLYRLTDALLVSAPSIHHILTGKRFRQKRTSQSAPLSSTLLSGCILTRNSVAAVDAETGPSTVTDKCASFGESNGPIRFG